MTTPFFEADPNEEPRQRFVALLESVMQQLSEIDAATVADPRWPNEAPAYWVALRRLRDECYRAKALAATPE